MSNKRIIGAFILGIILLTSCTCTIWNARQSANAYAANQFDGFVNSCQMSREYEPESYVCEAGYTEDGISRRALIIVNKLTCEAR